MTEEAREAFMNMKKAMKQYITLVPTKLEEGEAYILYTNAGELAAGAVLVQ